MTVKCIFLRKLVEGFTTGNSKECPHTFHANAANLFNRHLLGTCYVLPKVLIPVDTEVKGALLFLKSLQSIAAHN